MHKTRQWMRRFGVIAGIVLATAGAQAFMLDPTITVDRALNSPTLTIRYNGASAALVELKLNGVSLGTRTVTSLNKAGETSFTLDLTTLNDGENQLEVILLDKTGKVLGSQRTVITADGSNNSPVTLLAPRVGQTVQGPVEIKVGFGREMRNSYVSFFINNQFKSMTNFPPYSFVWDTTREPNGWHELEAWVVDENSTTFKTRKVRVFVNNPGGRTERVTPRVEGPKVDLTPKGPTVKANLTPSSAGLKSLNTATATTAGSTVVSSPNTTVINPMENRNALALANPDAGTKPVALAAASASGTKSLMPKVTAPVVKATQAVTTAANMVRITKGQRLPNAGMLTILVNDQPVKFDVAPRITNNIPLTPFRHLIEKAGGEVSWEEFSKAVNAKAEGRIIFFKVGDANATVNGNAVTLEYVPFIERGRTIVPLSFISEALGVNVDVDPKTGHVLITKK